VHPPAILPNIFEYSEYRRFLEDYYRSRKAADPKFSQRYIASQVKASSTGWFADIVKGRVNLSGSHMVPLIRVLKLADPEAEYFETLVRVDQAGSVDEKNLNYRRLLSLKGVKPELVGKERFEFYSHWYHGAIRELLFFFDFRGDYGALARKLQPPISIPEAKRSIRLLESLGFIHREASGRFRPKDATLKKDPAFKALHFANLMKSNMILGIESLDTFSREERDISGVTLSLSKDAFLKAKEEIRALRERLLALTEFDEKPDQVFQFNFHVFPVTK
jgi:uncharacterized protein (TIGR02147 family)